MPTNSSLDELEQVCVDLVLFGPADVVRTALVNLQLGSVCWSLPVSITRPETRVHEPQRWRADEAISSELIWVA